MSELTTIKVARHLQVDPLDSARKALFLFLRVYVERGSGEEEKVAVHCHTGRGTHNVLLSRKTNLSPPRTPLSL